MAVLSSALTAVRYRSNATTLTVPAGLSICCWHKAAPPLERLAESGLGLDPLSLGVDIGKADLDVLGPVRHEPPSHYVETSLARLGIVADDRQRIGGRHIPTRRHVRARACRRD